MPRRGDVDRYELVPSDYARRAYGELHPDDRLDAEPPAPRWIPQRDKLICRHCHQERERCRCCPTCGFPPGERGFLRLPFPRGHELFGRSICCPECWPWPFGHQAITANSRALSARSHEIAAMWDREQVRQERVRERG